MDQNALIAEMSAGLTEGQAAPQTQAPASTVPDQAQNTAQNLGYDPNLMISYRASNRDLNEPLSTIIQRAQRGYDYAQLVSEHKQRDDQLSQREQKIRELEGRWKPYEDFATQNPTWADHVKNAWENRFGFNPTTPQIDTHPGMQNPNLPPELAKEISELRSFRDEYMQERKLRDEQKAQEALNSEIDKVRGQYSDIDFGYTDPGTGKSLEMQILEHGIRNGINSFGAAFRDFYHDQLIARAEMKAKESLQKEQQAKAKQGFIAEGTANMMQTTVPQTGQLKHRSYEDLLRQGVSDLGIAF